MMNRWALIGAVCALAAFGAAAAAAEEAAHEDFVPLEVDRAKAMLGPAKQPTKAPFEHNKARPKSLFPANAIEEKSITLSCPSDKNSKAATYINVHAARYKGNKCQAKMTKEVVESFCQDRSQCTILVNDDKFTPSGCSGRQRLSVVYSCDAYNKDELGEGEPFNRNCANGARMVILLARYRVFNGRSCVAASSTAIVKAKCEGKENCRVEADNDTFGNQCDHAKAKGSTKRQLTVWWKCDFEKERPPPKHHKGYRPYNQGGYNQGGYNQGGYWGYPQYGGY